MRITSSVRLNSRIAGFSAGLRGKLVAALDTSANQIQALARKAVLEGPASGRIYGQHQASAPGEAPATDSGLLAACILVENTGEFERYVTAGTEYAAGLELGTAFTAPRPFMQPAVDKVQPRFVRAVEKALKP